jgi:putative Ca2+/H+ antiporter (TMEM165/GDT1 family)
MNFRLMAATFGTVFLAELGDKTQLATLNLAASEKSPLSVFLGSASALVITSAIAAVAGEGLARLVPPMWIERAAGVSFLVMGVWILIGKG